jgi:hypothetical protein
MKGTFTQIIVLGALSIVGAEGATLSTLPYSTNLDSGVTVGTAAANTFQTFSNVAAGGTASSSLVTLSGSDQALRQIVDGVDGGLINNTSASVATSALESTGFLMTTTFVVDSFASGGTINFSLGAYSSGLDLGGGSRYQLTYTSSANGTISLGKSGTPLGTASAATGNPLTAGALTLTFSGAFSGANLVLVGTLSGSNIATPVSLTFTDTSPSTIVGGDNFGFRTAINGTGAQQITVTDFSLGAIPEPTSMALLGLAGCAFGIRRKRD